MVKLLKKQIRPVEDQGKNKLRSLEVSKLNTQKLRIKEVVPENTLNEEAQMKLTSLKQ